MAVSGRVDLGWLVVDEQGTITHSHGEIPEDMVVEGGRLSDAVMSLRGQSRHSSLSDLLASVRGPQVDSYGDLVGTPRLLGTETHFTWNGCYLKAIAGKRSVLLMLQPSTDGANGSYRDAFHCSPVGMFRRWVDGTYLEVNESLACLFGYESASQMTGEVASSDRSLYVDEQRLSEFQEALRTHGVVRDFQSEVYRADGSTIWIAEFARTVADQQGAEIYYEGTVFDISHYRAAENALSASREQFRRLLETANVVPWEADASTGRVRYVGPQAEQLLNFPVNDWLQPGFWNERLHPTDRDWVEIVRNDAIKTLGRFESEYRLLNAQNEVVWVRDIVSVIEAGEGERILGGFLHNITHRRAAEEALRENQDFIEQIASASPLIWYVLDVDTGRIVYLNGGGIGILGFPKDSLLNMQPSFFKELAHPADAEGHNEHFRQLATLTRGEYLNREFRLRKADGSWVWVRTHEAVLRCSPEGHVNQVVGTAEDITVRKAALESLAKSEALFRRLAETTNIIPFEMNLSALQFTYIGPQAGALFGFEPAEWLESDFWSTVLHPEDRGRIELGLQEIALSPEGHIEMEFRLCDRDAEYRWVRQVLRVEAADDNQLVGRGFLLDISAAKSIEAEREESRRQLREIALQNQRAREEERLAMSRELHDELGQALTLLRIDLTWIASRTSRLLPTGPAGSLKEKIEEMEADIGKTLQIVRRITTQLRPPVLDELGLADAIEWQVKDFSRRVGVRCDVTAQPVESECKITATVVFRILQELLTNVARHSKASRVRVSLKEQAGILTLAVSDNGCGFHNGGGTKNAGLGLLGIRERAESLKGQLMIETKPGTGTTVTICVPTISVSQGVQPP